MIYKRRKAVNADDPPLPRAAQLVHAVTMRRVAFVLALLALGSALPTAAGADRGETPDETTRWVPSAAVSFEALGQRVDGSLESSDIFGAPLPEGCEIRPGVFSPNRFCTQPVPTTQPLTDSSSGSDLTTAALVGLSLELMAPRFTASLGRPRWFAHADGSLVFGVRRKLAGTGSPGRLGPPPPTSGGLPTNFSEDTITGQGSRAYWELQSPIIAAGTGLAFSFDVWGRRIRIKPSFEYMLQEAELEGVALRAVQLRGSLNPRPDGIEDYRLLSFQANKRVTHHGLGGGIEVEADTSRLGPFVLSVFIGGRVYRLLGDLDETLSSNKNLAGPSFEQPDGTRPEQATWHFEPENLVWRGGVGLRFRFLPE